MIRVLAGLVPTVTVRKDWFRACVLGGRRPSSPVCAHDLYPLRLSDSVSKCPLFYKETSRLGSESP